MAHLTLQLGAAIIVPFGLERRNAGYHRPLANRFGTGRWEARSLREAAAIDAGFPVPAGRFGRYAQSRLMPRVTAQAGGPLW